MATRPLKVFGVTTFLHGVKGQVRAIVATTSQRAAADAMGVTLDHLRTYGCETGNPLELEIALAEPGVVFWASDVHYCSSPDDYTRWEKP